MGRKRSGRKGVLITFEGIEGSGKTTQLIRLAKLLREDGHRVVETREPGGTPFAERIRDLLLSPAVEPITPECEAFLILACRSQHVSRLSCGEGLGRHRPLYPTAARCHERQDARGFGIRHIRDHQEVIAAERKIQVEQLAACLLAKPRYRRVPVVNEVSFTVKSGEVTGYLGPNGSGKSTTVKMLAGLVEPSSGHILLDAVDVRRDLISFKRKLGYVPEEAHVYPALSGMEYLQLMGRLRELPERRTCDGFSAKGVNEPRRLPPTNYRPAHGAEL